MITTWVLIVCTAGWGMCGSINEYEYKDEKACYRALDNMYTQMDKGVLDRTDFKYVVCAPQKSTK